MGSKHDEGCNAQAEARKGNAWSGMQEVFDQWKPDVPVPISEAATGEGESKATRRKTIRLAKLRLETQIPRRRWVSGRPIAMPGLYVR
jgi:hypothetical protein